MMATIKDKANLKKLIAEADSHAIGRKDNPKFPDGEFVILESTMNSRDHDKEGIYYLHTYLAGAGSPLNRTINGGEGRGRDYAGLANYPIMVMDNFTARKSTPLGAYYLLDSDCENVVANLRYHGIQVDQLESPLTIKGGDFQWFDASVRANAEDLAGWFEGRMRARVDPDNTSITDGTGAMIPTWRGEWEHASSEQTFPAGAYVVSTAQPLGMMAAILLEPGSNDGLFNWTYDEGVYVQNNLAVNHFDNRLDAKAGMVRANYPTVARRHTGGTNYVQETYHFPIFKVPKFTALQTEPLTKGTVNFPGIKGVTVQHYSFATGWVTVPGAFDDTTGIIAIPAGTTSVRAVKDGMYQQFDGLTVREGDSIVLDIPVGTITVTGIGAPCELAIVQDNWVYPYAAANVGVANEFKVFNNGKKYEVRMRKPDSSVVSITGVDAGQTVTF